METVQQFRLYMQSIVGFFVQEDHILNTSSGLIDRVYLTELWNNTLSKIIPTLKTHTVSNENNNKKIYVYSETSLIRG